MIPILRDGNTIKGFLADALSCIVTEERNGVYELELTYPQSGLLFREIFEDRLIEAKPNDTADNQLFRIYRVSKPLDGIITVYAEHISYALSHYPVSNISMTGITATQAINAVLSSASNNLASAHGFSVATSDIVTTHNFSVKVSSARSALGGNEGSVLDVYGGEYEFDNYTIKLHRNRGSDTGVIISYGKNLTDVKLVTSMENSYTSLFPYCMKDNVLTVLPEKRIDVTNNSDIKARVLLKDFTSMFESDEEIAQTALRTKANTWLSDNDINSPSINLTVSFIHLWQSPEYKNYIALEKVSLCDYVTIRHTDLGINVKAKVIKTVYDTLAERYTKIEIGSAKANFADTLKQTTKQLESAIKAIENADISAITQEFLQAIDDATNAITGNSGGYVVLNPAENPQELLVMNTANKNTASKVWRWNVSGLGYSSNGYSGPYRTAITMNGAIVADFITAGTLTANIIRAGVLSSVDGLSFFNLETGVIQTSRANITGGTISIGGDTYKTEISNGSLQQFLGTGSNLVGGVVPVGRNDILHQALYCSDNSNIEGIMFGRMTSTGLSCYLELSDTKARITREAFFEKTTDFTSTAVFNGTLSALGNTSLNTLSASGTSTFNGSAAFNSSSRFNSTVYTATKPIVTNDNAENLFAGLMHYRTATFGGYTYTASVTLGCGVANNMPSAALEVKNYGSNDIQARLDVYQSTGEAMICLRGNRWGTVSKQLELGSAMWFGGSIYSNGYLVSSTEDIKENIADTGSVLSLFKSSKIYKYNYIEEPLETADNADSEDYESIAIKTSDTKASMQMSKSATVPTPRKPVDSIGFVIGRETPNEVIAADGKHIDLYTMASINWKAIQEILQRLEALEGET